MSGLVLIPVDDEGWNRVAPVDGFVLSKLVDGCDGLNRPVEGVGASAGLESNEKDGVFSGDFDVLLGASAGLEPNENDGVFSGDLDGLLGAAGFSDAVTDED